jgi:flagellar hook-length control protein FliK
MSQKVAWIARDGGHTAHIRLDPPELGSLTVKVSVDSDSNTQISFIAATPQARDLLEGQMGRLREMLAQQGMDLSRADVDVSQQDTSGAQDRANNRNGGSPQGGVAGSDDIDEELIPRNLSYVSASGVDYYA